MSHKDRNGQLPKSTQRVTTHENFAPDISIVVMPVSCMIFYTLIPLGALANSISMLLQANASLPNPPISINSDFLSKPAFIAIALMWSLMIYYTLIPWIGGYELPRNEELDISLITWIFVGMSLVSTALWFFMQVGFIFLKDRSVELQKRYVGEKRYPGKMPLVSIIIPARNEETVIKRTIVTCLAQTYKAIEVIVVCHNCSDRTYSAAQSSDQRVRVFDYRTEAAGKGIALNYGVSQAKGEYLLVIDSDAILNNDFLAYAMPFFDKGFSAVQGKIVASNRHYNRVTKLLALEGDLYSTPFMTVRTMLDKRTPLGGTGLLISKEVLAKIGGFSNALIEDFELSFRIYRAGGRIAFAPLSIVYDEKPTNMKFMIRQRSRWVKGHFDLLKVKIPESSDIVGIIYWLNPIFMLGGLSAIGITSFAALYFLFFGVIPYQFSFVPVGVWIGATLASMAVQMVVLAKELGIKGLRYAGYAAYLAVFSHYWYVTLIKSFFVKSWSNNKTTHGFMSAKDIDTIIAGGVGKVETKA